MLELAGLGSGDCLALREAANTRGGTGHYGASKERLSTVFVGGIVGG